MKYWRLDVKIYKGICYVAYYETQTDFSAENIPKYACRDGYLLDVDVPFTTAKEITESEYINQE